MNAIIGASYGYQWEHLWPFVVSAEKHAPSCRVVLLSHGANAETLARLEEYKVWVVPVEPSPPYCASYIDEAHHLKDYRLPGMHIVCSRFVAAYCFLCVHQHEVDNALLVDVRDSLVGGDPFDFGWDSCRANVVREDDRMTIGSCPYNRDAIQRVGGDLAEFQDKPIVCSGAIIGNTRRLMRFLEAMMRRYETFNPSRLMDDQGVTNWLVHKEPSVVKAWDADATPIYHAGYVPAERMAWHDKAIVHQYDRFPGLAPTLRERLT